MIPGTQIRSAERLREEFDRAFAEPAREAAVGSRDFVLVATGDEQWALPLDGIRGIEHDLQVVRLPSSRASLLGVAGVRSAAVPVFSLAALVGASGQSGPSGVPAGSGAWSGRPAFALLESGVPGERAERVGVAFERLVQFARVPAENMFEGVRDAAFGCSLRHEDELYTVVETRELLRRILAAGDASGSASGSP